jgi:HEAT repeat protein
MEGSPSPAEAPETEPTPPETSPRQTTPFLVLQFFIFPMAIVAVCVTVFVIFGLIASEGKGARAYLDEVRTGSANRRWQAAFELSKVLQARKDPALNDPGFTDELVRVFTSSSADDPRVRRYLALALGRLGDKRAVPALIQAADPRGESPSDADAQIYAVWALGAIGDAEAVPTLVKLAAGEDAGVRKAAVHALGSFPGDASRAALAAALGDAVEDVRWNAAVSLARRRDTAAAPVLLQMMDRAHLASVADLSPDQADEAVLQAVPAAAVVPDPALRAALERLRDGDPNLKVRQAAREALEGKQP